MRCSPAVAWNAGAHNYYGKLGDGTGRFTHSASGQEHNYRHGRGAWGMHGCALLASGAVKCWGYNYYWPTGQRD